MTQRLPLVLLNGRVSQLPVGDTLPFAFTRALIAVTAAATLTSTAYDAVVSIAGTSAAYQIDLPSAAAAAGHTITLKVKNYALANQLYTVACSGSDNFESPSGPSEIVLTWNCSLTIYSDGTSWLICEFSAVTPWVDFGAMTITAPTTNPTKGTVVNDKIVGRRNGSNLELKYTYQQAAAGSSGSGGGYQFAIPFGLIDLTLLTAGFGSGTNNSPQNVVGNGWIGSSASGISGGPCAAVVFDNQNLNLLDLYTDNTDVARVLVGSGSTALSLGVTGRCYAFNVSVPIVKW